MIISLVAILCVRVCKHAYIAYTRICMNDSEVQEILRREHMFKLSIKSDRIFYYLFIIY